jgi:acetyl esterase/lipase
VSLYRTNMHPDLVAGIAGLDSTALPSDFESIAAWRAAAVTMLDTMDQTVSHSATVEKTDFRVPTGDGDDILVRLYRPLGSDAVLPVVVWIHGGGMIGGSLRGDDWRAEQVVDGVGCAVVSVDYRLAPEHPYPIPSEDCSAALNWVVANAAVLRVDASRLAIGGPSAGGGLAAGVVLRNRDREQHPIAFQYLLFPMIDDRESTASSTAFSDIPTWSREHNINGWRAYLGDKYQSDEVETYAAPYRETNLGGLPPALIQVGEIDTFRDEDIEYASRLMKAGVSTELHVYPGAYHGWMATNPAAPSVAQVYAERDEALKRHLGLG